MSVFKKGDLVRIVSKCGRPSEYVYKVISSGNAVTMIQDVGTSFWSRGEVSTSLLVPLNMENV